MLPSSSITQQTFPIVCKIIIGINVAFFIIELLFPSRTVPQYCLSPRRLITNFSSSNSLISLVLSHFFHSNPLTSGPFGIFHILVNMLTLVNIGGFLERELGSVAFAGITFVSIAFVGILQIPIAIITNFISFGKIPLLSLNQCSIGYSGVLFVYFMIYLKLIPNERINFCGMQVKKWFQPFMQLLLLSLLIRASFIGHLSGILFGMVYISGIPGMFERRHSFIKYVQKLQCLECISDRADFFGASQMPKIYQFQSFLPCMNRSANGNGSLMSHSVRYSQVNPNLIPSEFQPQKTVGTLLMGGTDVSSNRSKAAVPMTIIDGVLVAKDNGGKYTDRNGDVKFLDVRKT